MHQDFKAEQKLEDIAGQEWFTKTTTICTNKTSQNRTGMKANKKEKMRREHGPSRMET